jgi:transposase
MESLVPPSHPLRAVKRLTGAVLRDLDPVFAGMYAAGGRPSVAPERLLKASVMMVLCGVRSGRLFCEQLGYNMLFKCFLDMNMLDEPFDATTFYHNRARLLEHDVARRFFAATVERARREELLSTDHFLVDGTQIEAWGSTKSCRPKDGDTQDNKGFVDFRGQTRTNDTHESKIYPDARLFRKGRGREANFSHLGHVLIENRSGLVVDAGLTSATGTTKRDTALVLLQRERNRRKKQMTKAKKENKKKNPKGRRCTIAADKAYDTRDFVQRCRKLRVTPHVAKNEHARRSSAIDARTTRHPGHSMSKRARMLSEKTFGWLKTYGGLRRNRFKGREKTEQSFLHEFTTLNLLRIAKLTR